MKKTFYIALLPLILCACNSNSTDSTTSVSEDTSTTSTSVDPVEQTIEEKFQNYYAKFDKLGFDANKVNYSSTTVNYNGIEVGWTQEGNGIEYQDNFYREEFSQKLDTSTTTGVYEKGETVVNNIDAFYQITYYGDGDTDNKVAYYQKGSASFPEFSCTSFKGYYLNSFLDYAYSNYKSIKNDTKYSKITLECDDNDVDFTVDGTKKLNFKYDVYSGTTCVNELKSDDTVVVKNGKVVSSSSQYWITFYDAVNYTTCARTATYSYDESIKSYSGTKLNPSDFKS